MYQIYDDFLTSAPNNIRAKLMCLEAYGTHYSLHALHVLTSRPRFVSFLALLDYVSRAHEIENRPSSVVVCPSVCGIDYL